MKLYLIALKIGMKVPTTMSHLLNIILGSYLKPTANLKKVGVEPNTD